MHPGVHTHVHTHQCYLPLLDRFSNSARRRRALPRTPSASPWACWACSSTSLRMNVSLSGPRDVSEGGWGKSRAVGRVEGQAPKAPATSHLGLALPWLLCSSSWGPGVWFPDYSHGITLVTPLLGSEKKQVLHFCALGSDEMRKFAEDLKEATAEVAELEQIRIECKGTWTPGWVAGSRLAWNRVCCGQAWP